MVCLFVVVSEHLANSNGHSNDDSDIDNSNITAIYIDYCMMIMMPYPYEHSHIIIPTMFTKNCIHNYINFNRLSYNLLVYCSEYYYYNDSTGDPCSVYFKPDNSSTGHDNSTETG